MIWTPIDRLLWGVAITLLFVFAVLYINKGRKKENSNEKIMMLGFVCFFLGLAISRFLFYLGEMSLPGTYTNGEFYYDNDDEPYPMFYLANKLFAISNTIGMMLLVLAFEVNIKRTKYVLTMIGTVLIIILIIITFVYYDYDYPYTVYMITFSYLGICLVFVIYTCEK